MELQTAGGHQADRSRSARYAELKRAILRAIGLPAGNPSTLVKSAVNRLADLQLLAEQARAEGRPPGSIYVAELAVRRAERDLWRLISARRSSKPRAGDKLTGGGRPRSSLADDIEKAKARHG
jgi:hypothetical protein